MLRRFLGFTLGLFALFLTAGLLQDRLPESFRLFPEVEELLPPNPLRPFEVAYLDWTEKHRELSEAASGPEDQVVRKPSSQEDESASGSKESGQTEPASEAEDVREETKILESGKDFAHLKEFFESLRELESVDEPSGIRAARKDRKEAGDQQGIERSAGNEQLVRILHFGDSIMWGDNLSLKMKQLFQNDFGDGGRGLVNLVDSPSSELLEHTNHTRKGFRVHTIPFESFSMPAMPRLGFSGGSGQPIGERSFTHHSIPEPEMKSWHGVRVILGHPQRLQAGPVEEAQFSIRLEYESRDGNRPRDDHSETIDATDATDAIERPGESKGTSNIRRLEKRVTVDDVCSLSEIPLDQARSLRASFSSTSASLPMIDGMFLETDRGVSYSAIIKMGIHLAWMQMVPEEIMICGFRKAKPDLIIYQFGVNESASLSSNYRGFTREKYETQLRNYFTIIRKALPETSVLIVGPFERLLPSAGGPSPSRAQMTVREVQMQLAEEFGFAYFDAYEYLGGEGQMLEMVRNREAINDYTHLTRTGGDRLAQGIYDALITHYLIYSGRLENKSQYSVSEDFTDNSEIYEYEAQSVTDVQDSPGAIAFHSMDFAYFLFVVVLGGSLLLRFPTLRLIFLIIASYYFYASWKLWPVSLMLFSTILDYYCAKAISKARKAAGMGAADGMRAGLPFLLLSLAGNLGLLFFFKYYDFAAHLLNQGMNASGFDATIPALGLLLPVGISFYTFQTLSYTIDVYRGNLSMESSFLRFSLYVTFFPQLVAGPIVRASQFIPDIQKGIYHFLPEAKDFSQGTFQFLGGLIKKMGADWLAFGLIDRVYESPEMFTSAETLIVFYAYGLQIYGDFSGYTDMALGAARLMGFHLTDNFDRPYQSGSISEFWRRWHISLGSWFRDYVYISMGGNRTFVYRNLFITMFLAGLWHGAGLMFIGWGLYHGVFLMLERVPGALRRWTEKKFTTPAGQSHERQEKLPGEESLTVTSSTQGTQGGPETHVRGLELNPEIPAQTGGANGPTAVSSRNYLRPVQQFLTLHAVLLGWVLFRSRDLDQFTGFFSSLFPADLFSAGQWSLPNASWSYVIVVVLAYFYHMSPTLLRENLAGLWSKLYLPAKVLIAFLILVGLYQIAARDVQPFIYFQF